ncbi:MAG TPA: hypothetical protein VMR44_00495 [Thermoanaerobaculia bacterium]|nr:hypothetical protein [Thermoanaerobaculia bacterium]
MTRAQALLTLILLVWPGALPAVASAPEAGPSCQGELPFVLNAAVAPTGRFQLPQVEELAKGLFTALYRQQSPCEKSRSLQVNLAVASDYHVLQWLEEGSVDVAVISDVSLHLLERGEVELLEIDSASLDFSDLDPPQDLAEVILPWWQPTLEARTVQGKARAGSAREPTSPAAELHSLRTWLWSGLEDAPASLLEVHHRGEDRCPELDSTADPRVRLTFLSHLSTAGFVQPVAETRRWLAEQSVGIEPLRGHGGEVLRAAAEACFWRRVFDHACFQLEEYRIDGSETPGESSGQAADSCTLRWQAAAAAEPLVELRFGREVAVGPDPGSGSALGLTTLAEATFRDHLVVRRKQAEAIFRVDELSAPVSQLPAEIEALLAEAAIRRTPGDPVHPAVFRSLGFPEPLLGTRTFAFTPREVVELVGIHQRFSDRPRLALVLPGGGVKAAFQSRTLELLYKEGLLRNARAEVLPGANQGAARVNSVVGTSGGALLGFFVARLGPLGPWSLTEILWKRPSLRDADKEVYLNAFDIFGGTDLPRYLSLLAIYVVFAAFLALFSLRYRGWLAPERNGGSDGQVPSIRPALFWLLLGVLGLTPLFVKLANGATSDEHVPEFEGLLYAVLVVVAIFADQTLIRMESVEEAVGKSRGARPEPERRVWSPPGVLLGVGAALVAIPLLSKLVAWAVRDEKGTLARWASFLEEPVFAGEAYLLLGAVVAGLMLAAVQRARGVKGALAGAGRFAAVFVVGTVLAIPVLHSLPRSWLALLDRTPLLFLALGMILVTLGLVRLATAAPRPQRSRLARGYAWLEERVARFKASALVRRTATVLAPVVGCFVMLDLTRPVAKTFLEEGWLGALAEVSKLEAPRGGLAVCLGAVLVTMGGILGLHRRRNLYRLDRPQEFVDGVVFVILGLALSVYSVMGLAVFGLTLLDESNRFDESPLFQRLSELSLFELTPAFWLGLGLLTVLGSLAILLMARWGGRRDWKVAAWLEERLLWLCSRHPNGHLVSRRFVRLGLFGVGGLVWWNFVLAPALYGNRVAFEHVKRADARFEDAYRVSHEETAQGAGAAEGDDAGRRSYGLTAQFLAPANALEKVGTRFVLAVPAEEDCPQVRTSAGVVWRRFRAIHGPAAGSKLDGCKNLVLSEDADLKELMDYIFASGSPFPAFPPRRVGASDNDSEVLVDGGYSNLVPIEAAANLEAVQVLVIHSSNPFPPPAEASLLANLAGPLVHNVPRLFGFLYQRSQQLDRRSRSLLFVVSLAPPYHEDWPLLTDFRRSTVEKMVKRADESFEGRIGMVESWGPPLFQFHVTVPPNSE